MSRKTKFFQNALIILIAFCLVSSLFPLQTTEINVGNVTADETGNPPVGNGPEPEAYFYEHFIPPPNSFGIGETNFTRVNWSWFWQLFKDHSAWQLEAWHPVQEQWVDNWQGQNLNEWLNITRTRSEDNRSEKITLNVTNNHPTQALLFRFKFGIDLRVKQFVNRSSWYEYTLTYPANATENYTVFFNFSDIKPLIQNEILFARHGIKEIEGVDIFWFMLTANHTLGAGNSFVIDPEFGYGETRDSATGVDISEYPFAGAPHEHQAGLYGSPTSDGTLTYMLAYLREGYTITTLGAKAALYDASDMTIVDISNEVTIDGVMYTWYNFTFSGGEDIFDASNYYLTVYANAPAFQGPAPPTGVNIDFNNKANGYTYIREADMDNYPNFEDPWDGYTTYNDQAIIILCGYTEAEAETNPPVIDINFTGNLSDMGGPYWNPTNGTGESQQLTGAFSDGYYTNDSRQSEGWIYVECNITDDTAVGEVWLNWLNESTWTNWTYGFTKGAGNTWTINTSQNFSTAWGYNYSFNIVANDTIEPANSATLEWNKTGIGGSWTRRYVQLNCTQTNISYMPFYFLNYTLVDPAPTYATGDIAKKDRLHHDQGTDGTLTDTGYLINTTLTDTMSNIWCSGFAACWFEQSLCVEPIALTNIYVHSWWSTTDPSSSMYWKQGRGVPIGGGGGNDGWTITKADSRTNITIPDDGLDPSNNYYLETHYETIEGGLQGEYNFTDNNIYEFSIYIDTGGYPSFLCNQSIQSFILFNVPDNATLNASHADTDSDGLSDWTELYSTYTNPFDSDTDSDGVSDYDEYLSGSDPNNFTDTEPWDFIWIDITNATWDLGNIVMSSSIWTNETGKTFIADKDNCTVATDLKLQITSDGADWTAATSGNGPDANTYRLNTSIDTWSTEFQIVTASATTISSNIVADQNETFDLRFDAPTTSSTGDQQSITVTATLVQH